MVKLGYSYRQMARELHLSKTTYSEARLLLVIPVNSAISTKMWCVKIIEKDIFLVIY